VPIRPSPIAGGGFFMRPPENGLRKVRSLIGKTSSLKFDHPDDGVLCRCFGAFVCR